MKIGISKGTLAGYPELIASWHPTKNGNLNPLEISAGSGKKIWWKCNKADDHEWLISPNSRTGGRGGKVYGCPCCSGKKAVRSNSLGLNYPLIANEWHPHKNGNLTPFERTPFSNKVDIWWLCENGHEWIASCATRVGGHGCPFCCNQKVSAEKSLAVTHPELSKQWHSTKNGNLTPFDVTYGSKKMVWWQCPVADDHVWKAKPNSLTSPDPERGCGCPCCCGRKIVLSNCLATTHPELASQWHTTKNGILTPFDVTFASSQEVWWKCPVADDHEWQSPPSRRSGEGGGCSCCRRMTVVLSNCLATTNPELSVQWHTTKNGTLTPFDVVAGSNKKVWWQCPISEDHVWKSSINNRANSGRGCACCVGKKVVPSNSLQTKRPDIACLWHSAKNGNLTPSDVTEYSSKKVWWQCPVADDHVWEALVSDVSNGHGCPYCVNQRVCNTNSLAFINPEFLNQWHPVKNGNLKPNDIVAYSTMKIWWKCPIADDHEWQETPNVRLSCGYGCPFCSGKRTSVSNCLATQHPQLIKEWHPTKNGNLTPNDVTLSSSKKVWWKCPVADDHEYEASPNSRIQPNWKTGVIGYTECPCCLNRKVVISNNLATTHPELSKLWHPTKNGLLTASNVVAGYSKKVWWLCPKGHETHVRVSDRTYNNIGCPICHESRGERLVANHLTLLGVAFKRQIIFRSCRDKRVLPFDFLVRIDSDQLCHASYTQGFLIEFQGEQHYKPVKWNKNMSDKMARHLFESVKKRDTIKKEWADKHKIPLLAIPYWNKKSIGVIIDDFIKQLLAAPKTSSVTRLN